MELVFTFLPDATLYIEIGSLYLIKICFAEVGEVNLRIYLGDEYECPRGHRFFCSGPEKVIKVSSSSTVKVSKCLPFSALVDVFNDMMQKISLFEMMS